MPATDSRAYSMPGVLELRSSPSFPTPLTPLTSLQPAASGSSSSSSDAPTTTSSPEQSPVSPSYLLSLSSRSLGFLPGNAVSVAAYRPSSSPTSKDPIPQVLLLYPLAVRERSQGCDVGRPGSSRRGRRHGRIEGVGNRVVKDKNKDEEEEGQGQGADGQHDEGAAAAADDDDDQASDKKRKGASAPSYHDWTLPPPPPSPSSSSSSSPLSSSPPQLIVEPFPTLYWLIDSSLSRAISVLEDASQGVTVLTKRLRQSPEHAEAMRRASRAYGTTRWRMLEESTSRGEGRGGGGGGGEKDLEEEEENTAGEADVCKELVRRGWDLKLRPFQSSSSPPLPSSSSSSPSEAAAGSAAVPAVVSGVSAVFSSSYQKKSASLVVGSGVGGVSDSGTVRCLHMHVAHYLAQLAAGRGGTDDDEANVVGRWTIEWLVERGLWGSDNCPTDLTHSTKTKTKTTTTTTTTSTTETHEKEVEEVGGGGDRTERRRPADDGNNNNNNTANTTNNASTNPKAV